MDADHAPVYVDESFRQMNAAPIESDPDSNCLERIELAILYDNTRDFVELINNSPSHFLIQEFDTIWHLMIGWDSDNCFAAVLGRKTQINQIHHLVNSLGSKLSNYPLHHAAASGAYKITSSLLQRGFSADSRSYYDLTFDMNLENALPLHLVMTRLCEQTMFRQKEELSAIMVVLRLFRRSGQNFMDTLRLIALKTTEVKREFFNYFKEGKMIEVAALLLVAKPHILSQSTTARGEREFRSISQSTTAKEEGEFQSISQMHDFVLNTNNNKLVEMKEMLVLLEIFAKIGNELATLRLGIYETCLDDLDDCSELLAGSLLADAGFDVKAKYFDSYLVSYYWEAGMASNTGMKTIKKSERRTRTPDMLPSWIQKAALRRLDDKSGSTSRLTYPFLAEARPYMNSVSVSPLTPGPASPMPENVTPLQNLLKKTAPFSGTIRKMFRRL